MFDEIFFEFPKASSLIFVFLACEALCRLRERGIYFPHLASFGAMTLKPAYWLWFLKWASIALLVTALMSPVREVVYRPESPPGHAMAMVVDASASMRNGDFDGEDKTRSRFEVVQKLLSDFVASRGSDSVGLVVFGTHAFAAVPPTMDLPLLQAVIDRLYVGIAGKYTALYEAIAKGVAMLHAGESSEKVVIVLTDGSNTPGAPVSAETAAALAEREGARIYAIVIGDETGEAVAALKSMAINSGGDYFNAQNAAALSDVYAQIDALEKSPQRPPEFTVKQYYYVYPLFAGFLTLLLYVYWRNRRTL